jgi:outer membrane receptor protein involved in Fe transport
MADHSEQSAREIGDSSRSPVRARTFRGRSNRGGRVGLWRWSACVAAVGLGLAAPCAMAADESGLEEVVVTAEKYTSTILNTPISMSAMTGEQLATAGITSLVSVAHEIPGLSMRSAGPGQTEYEARGLASNGGASPTVGFYLDEIPLSPPAMSQTGKVVIDPNLYDIARIEVLRGPQGTLYGSGSMGGTIKVVTNQPKLNVFEGSVQGTLSGTEGGSGNGGGDLMLNIPLGSTMALRVVASDFYRSGWIDRIVVSPYPTNTAPGTFGSLLNAPVQSVKTNANTEKLYGARASLLFQPTDDLTIIASAMWQHLAMGAYDEFDSPPYPARMARYEAFDVPEPTHDIIHIYGLTITASLGWADLTSATSYFDRDSSQTQDASGSLYWTSYQGAAATPPPVPPFPPLLAVPYSETDPSHQFSQELRLSSKGDDRLHWVTGAFYSDLHSTWIETNSNPNNTVSYQGTYFESYNPYHVQQVALFADGSYKLTDQWKVSAGVRWYRYQSQQDEQEWGLVPYIAPNPTPSAPILTQASDRGFNPRFVLSYNPTADLTSYLSASKGFRPGGANEQLPQPACPAAPLNFGPDNVWDYELGEKARLLDGRVTINGDVYYIQWKDVQQSVTLPCGYQYQANAGDGRSYGPELEIKGKLTNSWTLSASGTYTDAKLTKPSDAYVGYLTSGALTPTGTWCASAAGCTSPILNVPRETGSLSLSYSSAVFGAYQLTGRISDSYVGWSYDEAYYFGIRLPSYSIANARLGLAHDAWSVNLFVDNLTNKVALITSNNTSYQFNVPWQIRYSTNQPRTFGTQVNYRF